MSRVRYSVVRSTPHHAGHSRLFPRFKSLSWVGYAEHPLHYICGGCYQFSDQSSHVIAVARRDSLFRDRYDRSSSHSNYDVFPGGRRFLMVSPVQSTETGVSVMLNWMQIKSKARDAAQDR